MNKNIKFLKFFIIGVLVISAIVSGSFFSYEKYFGDKMSKDSTFDNLSIIVDEKADRINNFLSNKKENVSFLSKTEEVKNILKKIDKGIEVKEEDVTELKSFRNVNKCSDLFMINREGKPIWSIVSGSNLESKEGIYSSPKLIDVYRESKQNGIVGVSTIELDNNKIAVFVSSPVLNDERDNVIGFIVLKINIAQLWDIVSDDNIVNRSGEIYLVNNNNFNITPLKVIKQNGRWSYVREVKKIKSKNIQACFSGKIDTEGKTRFHKNYKGDNVFGVHHYIPNVDWCVLAEINKSKVINNVSLISKYNVLFFGLYNFIFLIVSIFAFFIIRKNFIFKKRINKFQPSNCSFIKTVLPFVVLFLIVCNSLWLYKIFFITDDKFIHQVRSKLVNVANERKDRINDYLGEKKREIEFLSSLKNVKKMFNGGYVSRAIDAQRDTELFAEDVVVEIDNYLKEHPKMTLEDLQNSREFRQIAVQKNGQIGYSALLNIDTLITYFHENRKIENISLKELLPANHPLLAIAKKEQDNNGNRQGSYTWIDTNGVEQNKYLTFKKVLTKTADGSSLTVAATTYINRYKVLNNIDKEVDEYLKLFKKSFAYHNIMLVSNDGNIVYMAKEMDKLGINLKYDSSGIGVAYNNYLKNDDKTFFYGPFSLRSGELSLKNVLIAPLYKNTKLIGSLLFVFDMSKISSVTSKLDGLGKTGEDYLVDSQGYLISPLRFKYFDFLVQSVKTDNLAECFKDYREARQANVNVDDFDMLKGEDSNVQVFQNYLGNYSIGTHSHIPQFGWCLLTEIGNNESYKILIKKKIRGELIILAFVDLFLFIFIILRIVYARKKYVIKRK